MTQAGFFAQKRNSSGSFALVILLHAALIAAVVLIKSPQFIRAIHDPTVVTFYPVDPDPPEVRPPPQRHAQPSPESIDHSIPPQPTPFTGPPVDTSHGPIDPGTTTVGSGDAVVRDPPPPPPPVIRRGAEIDSSSALQPPYPPSEQRMGREGRVQIRVTIGANGRVTAVARLAATSDAFWQATERQALTRWRFRPATVDGRPVEDNKVLTITFRLVDDG